MRVFVTKVFRRVQRKERVADSALIEAIVRAEQGMIDADLGRHLIKQRVARPGQGRSGGYRTVIAYRFADKAFFIFGFAKNERDNIDVAELNELAMTGSVLLRFDATAIGRAIEAGELTELEDEDEA